MSYFREYQDPWNAEKDNYENPLNAEKESYENPWNAEIKSYKKQVVRTGLKFIEPRWGQLGNLEQIRQEMQIALINIPESVDIGQQFDALTTHFSANRLYQRDRITGKLMDAPGSNNVKRYIYTAKLGWIDMQHFSELADRTRLQGIRKASIYAYLSEEVQNTKVSFFGYEIYNRKASGYSYEDIPSDFAGMDFWVNYGAFIENANVELIDAIVQYLASIGATNPENAPNINYIPHVVNEDNMLQNMGNGLTGEKLKNAHKAVYDKRSEEDKKRIKDAHQSIKD